MKNRLIFLLFVFIPLSFTLSAQQFLVKGLVLEDETGKPLPGVNILIENSTKGVISNIDGAFEIMASPSDVLVFSFLGMASQTIEVVDNTFIRVVMKNITSELEEVTVVAYGVQKKESVVGAVTSNNPKDLKTSARSLTNNLAGNISGVIAVQRSGEPGNDDAQFWIRGISTFGAGSEPLILVDGVERTLSNIEPEEIESFTVLKDATATAVYGIRGANGVVLVNTRRGASGKPSIHLKSEYGIVGSTRLPQFVDAATAFELYNEANLNVNPNFVSPYTEDLIETYRLQSDPILYPNIDWIDWMMKDWSNNGRTNLNITGGGEIAKYFVSATYYFEDGIWKDQGLSNYNCNTTLKRYNVRVNTDIMLNKYTTLSLNLGGILMTQNMSDYSSDHLWSWILKAPSGDYYPVYSNPEGEGVVYGGSGAHSRRSPYADLMNSGYRTIWNNTLQSSFNVKYDLTWLLEGLSINGLFAFDANNYHVIRRYKEGDLYRGLSRDENGEIVLTRYYDGAEDLTFSRESYGDRKIYLQTSISYNNTFGKHSIGGLFLYNQQDYVNGEAENSIAALPYRYQGLVGRINYSFDHRYYVEVNAGYNGSENFSKGNRFGLFPSIGLGWIISEEKNYGEKLKDYLSYIKLRGSYGIKGNDQIGGRRFAYLTTIGSGHGGWRYGVDGKNTISGVGEDQWGSNLTWEVETELNIGFEARFLKSFHLQADFFKRHRKGIFMQRSSLPDIVGLLNNPWGNIGEMENRGFESSLEYRNKFGNIDFSLRGNVTFARNKILDNDQPEPLYAYQSEKGKRLGQPFGLIALGLYTDDDFIDPALGLLREDLPTPGFGGLVYPGDIKYLDYNEDGRVDNYDMVAIGNPSNPELVFGFGTSLAYKGFDISVFFQGLTNMDFMLGGDGFFPFNGSLYGITAQKIALDRWTKENPNQDVLFPRLTIGENVNNYMPSTWWQRDASYLRLKTFEVGYTLPIKVSKMININRIRIYFMALNPLTWSKFTYWDPELGSNNGAKYPIQRNYSIGLNINID